MADNPFNEGRDTRGLTGKDLTRSLRGRRISRLKRLLDRSREMSRVFRSHIEEHPFQGVGGKGKLFC